MQTSKPASTIMSEFRDFEWRELEQRRVAGLKHSGRFHAKMGPLDKKMNSICGGCPWRDHAQDRSKWQSLADAWVAHVGVPWASGNQFAIMWWMPSGKRVTPERAECLPAFFSGSLSLGQTRHYLKGLHLSCHACAVGVASTSFPSTCFRCAFYWGLVLGM